jgi:hypothetical protein
MLKRRNSQIWGGGKKGWAQDTFEGGFPLVQTMIDVEAESATKVVAATTLADGATTTLSGTLTDPNEYRALTITGNQSTVSGNVVITGKDWGDRTIQETITCNGAALVSGTLPFKSLDKVVLPARVAAGDTISIGVSSALGLYRPVKVSADVLLVERKATAATEFTTEALPTVSVTGGTFVPAVAITGNDSFKVSYLTEVF